MIPKAPQPAPESAGMRPMREALACLVVEDHTLIGQLLAGILRSLSGIGSVTTATTCAEASAAAADHDLDLLILDLKLPDGDGLGVLKAATRWHPNLHCIVLSSAADEFACPADLKKHVAALMDKTAPLDTLRFAVEAVVRRRLGGRPESVQQSPATMLRPRELEVFELIGKGKTTREIAEALGITVHTVNTHRKAIVAKLGVVGAELVRLATLYNEAMPGKAGTALPDSRRGKGQWDRLPG
jgi:DNA-binding NarL/FixJ family response regulator